MVRNNLHTSSKLRLIFIFMLISLSGQAAAGGKLTIVNGDQNNGTTFEFSPQSGQYACFYNHRNVLGEKHSVGPGESFSFIVTNSCAGSKPVQFSIFENGKRMAFKMHGSRSFEYIPIGSGANGYQCTDEPCLKFSSYDNSYTFTTTVIAAKTVAKAALKIGRMTGRWVEVCAPGVSCKKTISTSVTNGKSSTDIRSKEITDAVSESLTAGFSGEVLGVTTSLEGTKGREHSVANTTSKEIGMTREQSKENAQDIEVNYLEVDVASVWRWAISGKEIGGSGRKIEIETKVYGCSSTANPPGYLPRSPEHIKSCITLRKAEPENIAQAQPQPRAQPRPQAVPQARQFAVTATSAFANGMPSNPQAACESRKEQFLFFQGQDVWIYNNNTGQVNGPMPTSAANLPGNIDACVNGYNGKLYFFKGSQYWRYDISEDALDPGYPTAISAGWPGLPAVITAAARDGNNRLMFVSGDVIYGWDMVSDSIIPAVGSMRRDLPELPYNTDAAIYVHAKTLFYGGGRMFSPQTN